MLIELPYGIQICLSEDRKSGTISSNLIDCFSDSILNDDEKETIEQVVNALESFILAIALTEIRVDNKHFKKALETAVEAISKNL